MVRRRVGGFRKVSEKEVGGIKGGCSRNRGLRFEEGRGFYTGLYSRL
jgi:hypothetical protein